MGGECGVGVISLGSQKCHESIDAATAQPGARFILVETLYVVDARFSNSPLLPLLPLTTNLSPFRLPLLPFFPFSQSHVTAGQKTTWSHTGRVMLRDAFFLWGPAPASPLPLSPSSLPCALRLVLRPRPRTSEAEMHASKGPGPAPRHGNHDATPCVSSKDHHGSQAPSAQAPQLVPGPRGAKTKRVRPTQPRRSSHKTTSADTRGHTPSIFIIPFILCMCRRTRRARVGGRGEGGGRRCRVCPWPWPLFAVLPRSCIPLGFKRTLYVCVVVGKSLHAPLPPLPFSG